MDVMTEICVKDRGIICVMAEVSTCVMPGINPGDVHQGNKQPVGGNFFSDSQ